MDIKIIEVKEIETKDGKKFTAYKAIAKNGKRIDARFVRGCANVPTEPCIISVLDENANVDLTREYPVLWVKEVEECKPFERRNNLSEYF